MVALSGLSLDDVTPIVLLVRVVVQRVFRRVFGEDVGRAHQRVVLDRSASTAGIVDLGRLAPGVLAVVEAAAAGHFDEVEAVLLLVVNHNTAVH
ncbi:MAG: hypothetical protein ABW185_26705 [Sedimenticola sp.]